MTVLMEKMTDSENTEIESWGLWVLGARRPGETYVFWVPSWFLKFICWCLTSLLAWNDTVLEDESFEEIKSAGNLTLDFVSPEE